MIKAIKTTYEAEEQGLLPSDFRPVQRAYLKLHRIGLASITGKLLNSFRNTFVNNLNGPNPKLLFLDFLKLSEYIRLKNQ